MKDCLVLPRPGVTGYVSVNDNGRTRGAHVVAWEKANGRPVPEGMVIDHTCHNEDPACQGGNACVHRACVNPDHLQIVTRRENTLRSPLTLASQNAAKTHCPQGHEFTEDNTYRWNQSGGRVARACKTCHRQRAAERRAARKREQAAS